MSLIHHDSKFIFIHVPKCAGTSMESTAWLRGRGHSGHKTISQFYKNNENLDSYYKWCFVRNPWDRLLSAYDDSVIRDECPVFEKFVDKIYDEHKNDPVFDQVDEAGWSASKYPMFPFITKIHRIIHFVPQHLLLQVKGTLKMDFVGRFENLKEDWEYITKKLDQGKRHRLPKSNFRSGKRGPRKKKFAGEAKYLEHYTTYYTPNMIDKVGEIYKKDIELFNYEPPTL